MTPTVHGNLLLGPTATDQQDRDDTATTQTGLDYAIATAGRSVPNLPMRDVITSFAGLRAHLEGGSDDFYIRESSENFFEAIGIESPACPRPRPSACTWRDWWRKSWALRKSLISSLSAGISSTCGSCRCRSGRRWWSGIPPTAIFSAAVSRSARGDPGRHPPRAGRTVAGRRQAPGPGRYGPVSGRLLRPRVMELLSEELGVPQTQLTKSGGGSLLLTGETKEVQA